MVNMGMGKKLKAILGLENSDYTDGMREAEDSNNAYAASSNAVHDETLANVEAFREAKDMLGDMDSCLLDSTSNKILMGNGKYKLPSKITIDDTVQSFNLSTNKIEQSKVVYTFNPQHVKYYEITISENNKFLVTGEHPFYVKNKKSFVEAKDLKIGDYLFCSNKSKERIKKIKVITKDVNTYNFQCEPNNNFLIGNKHILTHNSIKGVTGGLDHFGIASETTTRRINNMGEAAAMTEGFIKPFIMMMILATAQSWQFASAIGAVSTAAMSMGAMVSLSEAKGNKAKAFWLTMTSVMWGLTAAQTAYAIAASGPLALATGAMITGSIMAAYTVLSGLEEGAQSTPSSPTIITHPGEDVAVIASRDANTGGGGGGRQGRAVFVLARNYAQASRLMEKSTGMNDWRNGGL